MEQKCQDPMERILLEHAQVSEWLEQMRAAAGFIYQGEQALGIQRLRSFYRSNVRKHFQYEEERLFPALRAVCPSPELNEALDELCEEHRRLLPRLDELLHLLERLSVAAPRDPQYRETMRRARLVGLGHRLPDGARRHRGRHPATHPRQASRGARGVDELGAPAALRGGERPATPQAAHRPPVMRSGVCAQNG